MWKKHNRAYILKLTEQQKDRLLYNGSDIFQSTGKELRKVRQDIQMVFQDPYSSLNPRKRIGKTLEEPLVIHNIGNAKRANRNGHGSIR